LLAGCASADGEEAATRDELQGGCRSGTQFMAGYESTDGHRDFIDEGIARGRTEVP